MAKEKKNAPAGAAAETKIQGSGETAPEASSEETDTPVDLDEGEGGESDETTSNIPDPEIARVSEALTMRNLEEAEDEPPPAPKPVPSRKAKKKISAGSTHVVTEFCGELHHNGQRYLAGEGIALSDAEAKALGPHVEALDLET